jgi:hypothetical protein
MDFLSVKNTFRPLKCNPKHTLSVCSGFVLLDVAPFSIGMLLIWSISESLFLFLFVKKLRILKSKNNVLFCLSDKIAGAGCRGCLLSSAK